MSLLRVERLSKRFGGVQATADVSFAVEPGQVFAVIGPNGAGKTSLFNLISGIYKPDYGRVLLDERDITDRQAHHRAAAGLARSFQTPQIFFNMTAIENVLVGSHLRSDTRLWPAMLRWPTAAKAEAAHRRRAAEILERIGLASYADADAGALPYGGLKRLEIARALAGNPKILLLDEPAAGLNHAEAQEIDGLLKNIARGGIAIVLIEHNMKLVMGVSDRILVLNAGRKLTEGTAAEVQNDPEVIAAYLGGGASGAVLADA